MAEYIERDALLEVVEKSKFDNPHNNPRTRMAHKHEHEHFLNLIMRQPAADVVEVVRCKKCKHTFGYHKDFVLCKRGWMPNDGFCSYGERKDGEG